MKLSVLFEQEESYTSLAHNTDHAHLWFWNRRLIEARAASHDAVPEFLVAMGDSYPAFWGRIDDQLKQISMLYYPAHMDYHDMGACLAELQRRYPDYRIRKPLNVEDTEF
jgi:hypothetical protein